MTLTPQETSRNPKPPPTLISYLLGLRQEKGGAGTSGDPTVRPALCSPFINHQDHSPTPPHTHCADTETGFSRASPEAENQGCRVQIHTQPVPLCPAEMSQRQSGLGPRTQVSLPKVASFPFERLIHSHFPGVAGKRGCESSSSAELSLDFPPSPQPASPLSPAKLAPAPPTAPLPFLATKPPGEHRRQELEGTSEDASNSLPSGSPTYSVAW